MRRYVRQRTHSARRGALRGAADGRAPTGARLRASRCGPRRGALAGEGAGWGGLTAGREGARRRGRPWWLIASHEGGFLEVLVLWLAGGERAVAVFSFEEEAELFLRFGAGEGAEPGDRWVVRQTAPGELASLLVGPLSDAGRVALDPLPGRLGGGAFLGLVSTDRERFVAGLLAAGGGRSARRGGREEADGAVG